MENDCFQDLQPFRGTNSSSKHNFTHFSPVFRIRIHRIRMFWGLLWIRIRISNLLVRIRFRIRILSSTSKKMKKNLDFYCFATSLWYLSLKNDINVPSKRNKHRNLKKEKNIICWHLEGHWRKEPDPEPDPHPDPLVKGTDPKIRIRTKMSRISNTAHLSLYKEHQIDCMHRTQRSTVLTMSERALC
jgi:hypothetical protein